MDELQLLEKLQVIKNKLDNNMVLDDDEYKLFSGVLFATAMGIVKKSLNYTLSLFGVKND